MVSVLSSVTSPLWHRRLPDVAKVPYLTKAKSFVTLLSTLIFLVGPTASLAQDMSLKEMPVFTSNGSTHSLNLLMTAKATTIQLLDTKPTAWVYEVCQLADSSADHCIPGTATSPYGGVRLQLQQGDHLRIRLINHLPPAPLDAKHAYGPDPMGQEMLQANPTNLHMHGLIVEPRKADQLDPSFGDYVYVLGYPQGKLPTMLHPGLTSTDKPIDYDIYVPLNHPSGVFWFHPHVHGLSLNQISEGLAGVITIGSPDDYLGDQPGTLGLHDGVIVRHLLLKDMEVNRDSTVVTQEDPDFCEPDAGPGTPTRQGWCPGLADADHTGGKWIFSVSGQVFPSEQIKGKGEVWRIVSGSGSRGYSLALQDDTTGNLLPFQVLSLDGVSIDGGSNSGADLESRVGKRIVQAPCPVSQGAAHKSHAICATSLRMMPSARTDIWVPSHIAGTNKATFITKSLNTGPYGDTWPSVGLVRLTLAGTAEPQMLEVRAVSSELQHNGGILVSPARVSVPGTSGALIKDLAKVPGLSEHLSSLYDSTCKPLPAGHTRRVFFGLPADDPDGFGLGYEELDEKGRPVPGTFKDIESFDHLSVAVCLPLAEGNQPVTERWELVNVSGEDHNFHIHQTRFKVLAKNAPNGDANGLMDNVPVPHGNPNCDGSIGTWRQGSCVVPAVTVEIPFAEIGDFVYHCHILEHEDGGMMAHIRVVAHP